MNALHTARDDVEQQLADPVLYDPAGKDRLQTLLQRKAELDKAYAAAEEAWLSAAEALELAEATPATS
jgi:hypothetical protein